MDTVDRCEGGPHNAVRASFASQVESVNLDGCDSKVL